MTIREESIDKYTDIRYDGNKPVGIVTNRENLDAARRVTPRSPSS